MTRNIVALLFKSASSCRWNLSSNHVWLV